LVLRNGLHAKHLADSVIVLVQFLARDLRRPAVLKDDLRRDAGNVGVDQRAAADTRSLNDRHAFEDAQVHPAVVMFRAGLAPDPFVFRSARVGALVPFLAALEDQNFLALLCETAAGDGAAETAANHDDVEIHRQNLRSAKVSRRQRTYPTEL